MCAQATDASCIARGHLAIACECCKRASIITTAGCIACPSNEGSHAGGCVHQEQQIKEGLGVALRLHVSSLLGHAEQASVKAIWQLCLTAVSLQQM